MLFQLISSVRVTSEKCRIMNFCFGLVLKNVAFWSYNNFYSTAALYVHWPYCKRRCTYCNFNKYIDKSVNHEKMKQCLMKEAETLLHLSDVHTITSVFIGGGTPSLAPPETIKSLLDSLRNQVNLYSESEVSMEINPNVEMENLKKFVATGVNRLSIGIQTLNSQGLHILGRDHSAEQSIRCLEIAKMLLPNHVSIDLIFGWPGQSLKMWLAELKNVLQFCDNHISLYQLTVERGAHLFKLIQKKELQCTDPEVLEEMYLQAVDLLAEHGFERYEVSNFAKQQYYSHHNLSYWTGQDYIGIGPGAHGRFTPKDKTLQEARIQTLEPNDWIWEVEKYGHATRKRIPLTTQNQLEELLTVGLRTKYGVSNILWSKISPEKSIKELLLNNPRVKYTIEAGLLQFDNRNLKASKEGMNIIDSILSDLLSALEEGIKNNAKQ